MKHVIVLIAFAALFSAVGLFGQDSTPRRVIRSIEHQAPRPSPAGQTATLPDNYQVKLTIADKEGQPIELSVVVASSLYSISLAEQGLTFSGTVEVDDSGSSVLVAYALGWETPVTVNNSTQFKTSATQGSVRLKLGAEVQIIRAGTRTARLSVSKLTEPEKAK